MPRQSVFQKQRNKALKERAGVLYREGLSTREVGKVLGRSHTWVSQAIKSQGISTGLT